MSAQPQGSKWRRLLWVAGLSLAMAAIAWQVAKRAIDVDQYRPQIEVAIAEFTGLPVTIGVLELAWHPVPCLSAHDVSIGEGDFHGATTRLDVFPRLAALLRLRLEIARINVVEPAVTLPAERDRLESHWQQLIGHIDAWRQASESREPAPVQSMRIDELLVQRAQLQFGLTGARRIVSSITATGIGGDHVDVALEAEIPGTSAHAEGTLRLPRHAGTQGSGEFMITGLELEDFADVPEIARGEWQAEVGFNGKLGEEIAIAIEGRFSPKTPQALGGEFTGHARIAADGKTRADLDLRGEGLDVRSTARLFAGDRSRVRIKSASARGPALAALLKAIDRDPIKLRGARAAAVDVQDLGIALAPAPRLTSGRIRAHGVRLSFRGAPIAPELRLDARAADGALQISELRGGPVDRRGAVAPDLAAHRVTLDLSGTIGVDEALLHALGVPPLVRAATGSLAVEALHAEIPTEGEAPASYSMRAQLVGGSVQIESDSYAETLSAIELRLSGDQGVLHFDARARGAALGPLSASAEIDPAMSRAQGTIAFEDANASFLRDAAASARYSSLLRVYSGAPIAFEIQRDAEPPHVQRIRLARESSPRVNAAIVIRSEPREDTLRDLDIAAELPAEALIGFLPEDARASGVGSLRVRRSAGGAGFFAELDLGGFELATGRFFEKKAGEALTLRVDGEAGAKWQARKLILAAEKGQIAATIGKDGIFAPDLDVDLAAFSFLLVDGARAEGRLRGGFSSATESVQLQLVNVGVWLTPDLLVEQANGEVAVAGHDWGVRDLRVRGRDSDATLDIAVKNHQLRGRVVGERIDADFVQVFFEQLDALEFPEREPHKEPGTSGQLAIAVDHVAYHRATVERLTAAVEFADDDIHVRSFAFAVGEGRVSGRADVDMRKPEPPLLDLDLEFSNVVARPFIDALMNDEPRPIPGAWDGKLRFTAPMHRDLRSMMPDANGSLVASGRNGTLLGQLGLTTKIVTVLRSTETLRMRFPTLRDEGLVFDKVQGEMALDQGRLELRSFELDSTSYAITATGEANFREDTSRIPIEVNAIRGIASLVERVPVAGDALKIVNVRLVATGSPYDMQVRVASIQDQLIGAGLAGPRAVIKGVRDAMRLMGGGGGREPAPNAEAAAPAPEPPADTAPAPQPAPVAPSEPSAQPTS